MRTCTAIGLLFGILVGSARAVEPAASRVVWLESERFDDYGGWVNDSQFIDQMGSPYLLANGLGDPVGDAVTRVKLPGAGKYRLWARSRDWVPEHHPGRFAILLDGRRLEHEFGAGGQTGWYWEDGGVQELGAEVELRLHDLTGYYGRCDAIVLSADLLWRPSDVPAELARQRQQFGGVSPDVRDAGPHDVVVVGGGLAGCMAAVSAARLGARVALVQNRPVLGGNASVEILVPPVGARTPVNLREAGLIEEVRPGGNQRFRESYVYSGRLLRLVKLEPNLDLFLDTHATGVEMQDPAHGQRAIAAVLAVNARSGQRLRLPGRVIVDCTGDGALGVAARAEHRHGKEPRAMYNESLAPEVANEETMGNSLKYAITGTDRKQVFAAPPWVFPFPECASFGPKRHPHLANDLDWQWMIELGGTRDTYRDAEEIRDDLLRLMYGMWDHVKNQCPTLREEAANYKLAWMGYVAGRRESNRLLGDYVMTEHDVLESPLLPDRVAYGGWGIDDHYSPGFFYHGPPSNHVYKQGTVYSIPYRSLYSKNVENLLMAGRNISASHVALCDTRVMLTCSVIGQAAGTAAGMCIQHETMPRGVYQNYLAELQQQLLKDGAYIINLPNRDPHDLARAARASASSEETPAASVLDGFVRPEREQTHAWRAQRDAAGPHWVELAWTEPKTFNMVHVTFSTKDSAASSFAVEAWQEGAWKGVAQVRDSRHRRHVLAIDRVTAARLRVVLTDPAPVSEIRVYDEPPRLLDVARRAAANRDRPDTGPGLPWNDTDAPPVPRGGKTGQRNGDDRQVHIDPKTLPGIILDANDAEQTGSWGSSAHTGPMVGDDYLSDGNADKGSKSIRFRARPAQPGRYEVRLAYSALPNRASNTPVTITTARGSQTARLNQRQKPPIDGLFASLGTFDLAAGESLTVEVSNAGTDGFVVVDALQLLLVKN